MTLPNLPDGTFDLSRLRLQFRDASDPHCPRTSLVCIENPHNQMGGGALPTAWIADAAAVCRELGVPLHCDGARIFNAAAVSGVPAADLVRECDSVSFCLSKGLGAPIGAVVVGTKDFVARWETGMALIDVC